MKDLAQILNTNKISEVYEQYPYFPYELLLKDSLDLQFVIGVRGDGKTHNAKKWVLKEWFTKKIKSYWIVPTIKEKDQMVSDKDFHIDLYIRQDQKGEFSKEDYECSDYSERVEMKGDRLWDSETGEWFMKIIALSEYSKHKKGGHPGVHRLIYDEFMKERYEKNEAMRLIDLLTSVQREKEDFKFIFLGNAISSNHPLLNTLGVLDFSDKIITTVNDSEGVPIARIWNWKRDPKVVHNKKKKLLSYRLGALTGYNDYAVHNIMKNDNMNEVYEISIDDLEDFGTFKLRVKTQDTITDIYNVPKQFSPDGKSFFYGKRVDTRTDQFGYTIQYALHKDDIEDNVFYRTDLAQELGFKVQMGKFKYDSPITKQNLWETIKYAMKTFI